LKQLYIANCESFLRHPSGDVRTWANIYKLLAMNVSLVDRTERFSTPFNFKLYEQFRIPTDLQNFSMSYEDCCALRVKELLAIQDKA
jgi:hypothetical protein